MNIVIATIKTWNIKNAYALKANSQKHHIEIMTSKDELSADFLASFQPDYVFFPHWSWIIPASIYEKYCCIVFHMTDLPFGRGGSPLQNLLVRGIYETKISAIRVSKGIDTGDIYMKYPVNIESGSAQEIFERISNIVFAQMIPQFITGDTVTCIPQSGTPTVFDRRTPEQSQIPDGLDLRQLYDYIRMLDGEGYPPAQTVVLGKMAYLTQAQYDGASLTVKLTFAEKN